MLSITYGSDCPVAPTPGSYTEGEENVADDLNSIRHGRSRAILGAIHAHGTPTPLWRAGNDGQKRTTADNACTPGPAPPPGSTSHETRITKHFRGTNPMTILHQRSSAFLCAALLLLSTLPLAAQTAPPQVVFNVQIVQADTGAANAFASSYRGFEPASLGP